MKRNIQETSASLMNNRKLKVFLFFLVLTFIIWLLVELSKTYNSAAKFKLKYTNVPEHLLLQHNPENYADLVLKAPGFSLLKYKIRAKNITLNLSDIKRNSKGYYVLPNLQKPYLTSQLSGEAEVLNVLKDSIYIDLGVNISKKVPVNLLLDLKFKLGYNLTAKGIVIKPDSIKIKGPKSVVDSIIEINTITKEIEDIYDNIDVELPLEFSEKDLNVKISAKKVKVFAEVDKFTEGVFEIPVAIINVPEDINVKSFPKEVKVFYQAGLSNFNKITTDNLKIVYDYNQYKNDTLITRLSPVVQHRSEYISTLKIVPEQIEFLIHKQ